MSARGPDAPRLLATLVQLEGEQGQPGSTVLRSFPLRTLRSDGGQCILGRSDEAEVRIDDPSVSREHVVIRAMGAHFGVADLGSANGSALIPAAAPGLVPLGPDPVALCDGDVIVVAGALFFRFDLREASARTPTLPSGLDPRLAALAAGVVLLLVAIGVGWWLGFGGGEDPLIVDARARASAATAAAKAGHHSEAVDSFREAVGLLFGAGRLDDVPRGDVVRVGLERLSAGGELEGTELWKLFQQSLELREDERSTARSTASFRRDDTRSGSRDPANDAMRDDLSVGEITDSLRNRSGARAGSGSDARGDQGGERELANAASRSSARSSDGSLSLDERMDDFDDGWNSRREARSGARGGICALAQARSSELPDCLIAAVDQLMIDLRQDTGNVPVDFHRKVGKQMLREHRLLTNAFRRRELVEPMMRKALTGARLPEKLHYLALIESGYRRDARSPAGATGLWQFMKGTGKQYGLRIDGNVDERRDPVRSSEAAARYLRDLTFEFGGDAILLALASYNRGENAVRRSLKKLDDPFSDRSYWRLVERGLLPEETALYVTRFAAAAIAGEHGLPAREELDAAFGDG